MTSKKEIEGGSDYERMARLIMNSKRPEAVSISKPTDILAYLDQMFSGDTESLEVRTGEWRKVRQYITDLEGRLPSETRAHQKVVVLVADYGHEGHSVQGVYATLSDAELAQAACRWSPDEWRFDEYEIQGARPNTKETLSRPAKIVDGLEALLEPEDSTPVEVLPDGSVRPLKAGEAQRTDQGDSGAVKSGDTIHPPCVFRSGCNQPQKCIAQDYCNGPLHSHAT